MTWTINDILIIIKEGVPYSSLEDFSIQEDPANNTITVIVPVMFPLEKLKNISTPNGNIGGFLREFINPELTGGYPNSYNAIHVPISGNYIHYNASTHYWVKDGFLRFSLTLSLNMANIGETRRRIEESTFHSLLEAALENQV